MGEQTTRDRDEYDRVCPTKTARRKTRGPAAVLVVEATWHLGSALGAARAGIHHSARVASDLHIYGNLSRFAAISF